MLVTYLWDLLNNRDRWVFLGMEIFAPSVLGVREIFARSLVSLGARNSWEPVGGGPRGILEARRPSRRAASRRAGPGRSWGQRSGVPRSAGPPKLRTRSGGPRRGVAAAPDPLRLGSRIGGSRMCGFRIRGSCAARISDWRIPNVRIPKSRIQESRIPQWRCQIAGIQIGGSRLRDPGFVEPEFRTRKCGS